MNKFVLGCLTALGFIGSFLILGWTLMLLWNWLMPTIFGLPLITFWQAVGLNLLSTILFKSTSFKSNK